ncbi:MAG: hypothetical protein IPO58_24450 [Betaproteobacteria bacterium]|nr:hypothetical protein [Betaproteobacteria bacterium]
MRTALDVARLDMASPEHRAVALIQAEGFQFPFRKSGQEDPPAPDARR